MLEQTIFRIAMPLGYLAWGLLVLTYIWPRLRAMAPADAQRVIATLHSFRFFGLVFLLPGFVGPSLDPAFAGPAAYGDLAASLLAILALLSFRLRAAFWGFVVAFNVVGLADLLLDFWHAVETDLPHRAGQLGAAFAIPVLYVPVLIITHVAAFVLMWRLATAQSDPRVAGRRLDAADVRDLDAGHGHVPSHTPSVASAVR